MPAASVYFLLAATPGRRPVIINRRAGARWQHEWPERLAQHATQADEFLQRRLGLAGLIDQAPRGQFLSGMIKEVVPEYRFDERLGHGDGEDARDPLGLLLGRPWLLPGAAHGVDD